MVPRRQILYLPKPLYCPFFPKGCPTGSTPRLLRPWDGRVALLFLRSRCRLLIGRLPLPCHLAFQKTRPAPSSAATFLLHVPCLPLAGLNLSRALLQGHGRPMRQVVISNPCRPLHRRDRRGRFLLGALRPCQLGFPPPVSPLVPTGHSQVSSISHSRVSLISRSFRLHRQAPILPCYPLTQGRGHLLEIRLVA